MNDTRFSSAIHMLVMVAKARTPMSSAEIAESIGTNPAHIRRLAGQLQRAGLIEGHRGRSGFALTRAPEQLTLIEVYKAACDTDEVAVFEVHRNPSDACIVGRHIRPVLGDMFADVSAIVARKLESLTLADCIARLGDEIAQAGEQKELEELIG